MDKYNLLDCTLRDGGYVNDWEFGHNIITEVYKKLDLSGMEYIEVGFLDDRRKFDLNRTIVPNTSCFNILFDNVPKKRAVPVAMIDFGTCDINNIDDCADTFIDGIRVIFKKEKINEALPFCNAIKNKGYKLFIQAISITSYSDDELIDYVAKINEIAPFAFSIVDTYGLLDSKKLTHYFKLIDEHLSPEISMGYHGHNNFQLAFSNTIRFLEFETERNLIADSAVYGMGKSAGNCASELISFHLNQYFMKSYDVSQILEILDTDIMPIYRKRYWGYRYNFFISAMENCHPDYVKFLLDKRTLTVSAINKILAGLPEQKKLSFDSAVAEKEYIKFQSASDVEYCQEDELKEILSDKKIILLGPGGTITSNIEYIAQKKTEMNAIIISANFVPDKIQCDFVFVSNAKRYSKLVNQLNGKKIGEKLILTTNVNAFDIKPDYRINYQSLLNDKDVLIDNALILCISMLMHMEVTKVFLAGFDGFANENKDYYDVSFSFGNTKEDMKIKNDKTINSLKELKKKIEIEFLTPSLYQGKLE